MTRKNAILTIAILILLIFSGGICFLWYTRRRKLTPSIFYIETISEIAETIIPETATPGAKQANVAQYIVSTIETCLSIRNKEIILLGLEDLDLYCNKRYTSSFAACSQKARIEILEYFQNKGSFNNVLLNKIKKRLIGPSFFELVKDLTVTGYCTSKIGATEGLAYDHIPVEYIACMPMDVNQRSWATS